MSTIPSYKMQAVVLRFTQPHPTKPGVVTEHEKLACGHVIRARARQPLAKMHGINVQLRQCFECGRIGVK